MPTRLDLLPPSRYFRWYLGRESHYITPFERLRWKNGDVIVRHVGHFAETAAIGTDSLLLTAVDSRFVIRLRWLLIVSELDSARLIRTALVANSRDCSLALIRSGKIDIAVGSKGGKT
jgi:hypothetical protein